MKTTFLLLALSCTIRCLRCVDGARILGMFPLQGKSHFVMFQEVMKSLADAGHRVDVVSHFPQKISYPNYTDLINLAGTTHQLVNNLPYELVDIFRSMSLGYFIQVAGTEICNLLEHPDLQKLIKSPPMDPPYDLIITELFVANCYFAFGRHLKVPLVALNSAIVLPYANEPLGNPLNPAFVSEIMERSLAPMNFWDRFKNTFVIWYTNIQMRHYMRAQNDIVRKHFGPDMPDIEELERDVSLLLMNSHYVFNGIRPLTPAIVEVAGIHVRDDGTPLPTELQKWLDDSKDGFIYFSFGSMVQIETFPKAALAEIYEGLAAVAPIRILMKVAHPQKLPPGLPDNVETLKWAPQVQVLKHKNIRGFVTHGGLMGLQEAMTFAVPLLGVPLFGDQMGNIDICVNRGIAVSLDYKNLKASDIAAAINAVSHDPKYKNNMNVVSKQFLDRPVNAKDTAVFWIEYILKHGGDALRSPATKLTWWQLALLDVYGVIIVSVLLVLFILKLLLSLIINRVWYSKNPRHQSSKKRN